jgi:hypothetical protein
MASVPRWHETMHQRGALFCVRVHGAGVAPTQLPSGDHRFDRFVHLVVVCGASVGGTDEQTKA